MPQALPPPDPPQAAIVITAKALPDPAADRAYSVETFSADELVNSPGSQLDQVLKRNAGLQLFRRSDARSAHPTSQGVTLRALGGSASSRALLTLDGVPQADPFGGWVNWPAYDPAALAQVRVIRGGGSVANGPGALAGSIEMTSNFAAGVAGRIDTGSRGSLDGALRVGTHLAGGVLGVSAQAARGDGFIPVTDDSRGPADRRASYRHANLRGLWVAPISPDVDLQLSAAGLVDDRDRGLAFTGNRTVGADASMRLVADRRWQWSALAYAQWRELESSFANVSAGRTTATRVLLQDSVPSRAFGASIEVRPPLANGSQLRLGGDARLSSGESRELFSFVAGNPTRRRVAGGDTATAGMFGEITASFNAITLSGGARLDHWRVADGELREWLLSSGASLRDDRYGERSGWLPTARAGALLDAGGGLSLRSAAYLGWRLPTLNELFRPFRAGLDATAANPLLDPERLAGIEAGLRFQRGPVTLSLTGFANRLKDSIANVTLGSGPGTFPGVGFVAGGGEYRQRRNIDLIRARGLEGAAEARSGAFLLRFGASLTDAEVAATGQAAALDGLRPAQTPRLAATIELRWQRGGKIASLELRHVGAQFEDDLNQRKLAAATTVDGYVAWPIAETLRLVLRGENLLDELVVAGIGGDGSIERATPRTLWLGLRLDGPLRR